MESSGSRFASSEDLGAPPDSWEVADLDASVRRLMLSSAKKDSSVCSSSASNYQSELGDASNSAFKASNLASEDEIINSVDQFLREAIQNPRERLSVLRMEQDMEKFVRDRTRQEMEFQQLPTSYLRLAAHRLAQHYSLQSMVLMDNSLPDGSGSKIIVRKTSECRMPLIRLADIPVNLPADESGVVKVAIKQRPQKGSHNANSSNSQSSRGNSSKSVEERKEEYNRARARIFNSSSSTGGASTGGANGKSEGESRAQSYGGVSKVEQKLIQGEASDVNIGRGAVDLSAGSSRPTRSRTEKEPVGRSKTNNRVAIFRDREIDRKDPDYDRRYDRYVQRFDPGFGFSGGPYTIQPMYAPAVNYNTEFPTLGAVHRPPISTDHQPRPHPQHLPGTWAASSGIGYVPTETMISPFSPNHVGGHSNAAVYLHSAQYSCQRPGMPFIHPHEQVHQSFSQAHQQQPDTSFGLARPR